MLTQNRSGLNFENSGAVPIHLTLLNDNAAADATAYFFRDTVVNEQYIGDTGNVFLNRLTQEAVSNGIPLTNVFEVRAGKERKIRILVIEKQMCFRYRSFEAMITISPIHLILV